MNGIATISKNIAAFISGLFGKTYQQSVNAAKKAQALQNKTAKGTANNNNTSGLDELNVLEKGQSGTDGETGGINFDAIDAKGPEAAQGLANKFKEYLSSIGFDELVNNFKAAMGQIWEQIQQRDFGKAIASALDNGAKFAVNLDVYKRQINRNVHTLDDVTIKVVPSARMKSKYNFTDGCVPATDAKQINFILVHPSAVICRDKYAYIKLFTPGSDSRTADGYLYQNRCLSLIHISRYVYG